MSNEITVTMTVRGMMCPRCEARAQKALLAVPAVFDAVADRSADRITVTLREPVEKDTLKAAVENAGYQVDEIQ